MFDLSPDGTTLCYVRYKTTNIVDSLRDTIAVSDELELARKDLASGAIVADTATINNADCISWSPKGDKIAYTSATDQSGVSQMIAVLDISSGRTTRYAIAQLQTIYGNIQAIEWSKDEQKMYFSGWTDEGVTELFLLDITSGAVSTFNSPSSHDYAYSIPGVFRARDIGEH
jgi:Tol biopolymer transport system component